jgi:hypothetical protein
MSIRSLTLAVLAAMATGASAQAPPVADAPSKLPIDVPHGATVNFEADSPGSQLMPVIQQLMDAHVIDTGSRPDTIVLKTGLGDIELRPRDVAALLRPVRELHVVVYTLPSSSAGADPLLRHEEQFTAEGMRRVTNEAGFLLMRRSGDRYAAVLRQKDNVTVLRIDGMPDLGAATTIVLRSLATAAQHAGKTKS